MDDEQRRIQWISEEFERHRPALLRLCVRLLHNRDDAEEIVSETYIKATQADIKNEGQSLKNWLLAIASNEYKALLRKRNPKRGADISLEQPLSTSDSDLMLGDTIQDSNPSPEEQALEGWLCANIEKLTNELWQRVIRKAQSSKKANGRPRWDRYDFQIYVLRTLPIEDRSDVLITYEEIARRIHRKAGFVSDRWQDHILPVLIEVLHEVAEDSFLPDAHERIYKKAV